jgi:hypothetical protein
VGSIIAIFIAITPYIFYLYESFPSEPTWETSWFIYESKYYEDIRTLAWVVFTKMIPLILLIIWFTTCKHWWYHIILIPIAMYVFQIVDIFGEDKFVDTNMFYYVVPVMMVIVPLVYLIRLKLFDKYVLGIDLKKIDKEIKELDERETLRKFYHQKKKRKDKATA